MEHRNYPKYSEAEVKKVKELTFHTHEALKVKHILLSDKEFFYDAVILIRLWYAKHKQFSITKEFRKLVKEYKGQLPLITAKSIKRRYD